MRFRMPWWMRRYLRRHMEPLSEAEAWKAKENLSFIYLFFTLGISSVIIYKIFSKDLPKSPMDDVRPALWFAHKLGIEKAHVVRISGTRFKHDTIDTKLQPLPYVPPVPPYENPNPIPYEEVLGDDIFSPSIYE